MEKIDEYNHMYVTEQKNQEEFIEQKMNTLYCGVKLYVFCKKFKKKLL